MSQASEVELLMLELINEERTSRGLDPLSINDALNDASEDHSQWMLETDTFSHAGAGGSTATQRIDSSDYALEGSWRTAENIGWQSERGEPGIADDVRSIHESLMNSDGHRANILNPDLQDIGIGIETGDFSGYDAVMVTQNFGRTDAISDEPPQDQAPLPPVADVDDTPDPILTQAPDPDAPPSDLPDNDTPAPEEEPDVAETPTETDDDPTDDEADDTSAPSNDDMPDDCPDDDDEDTDDAITINTQTVTTSTIAQDGRDPITVMTEETVATDMASPSDDFFDFCNFEGDDFSDDVVTMTGFAGTITTNDGTFETDDQADFDMMLADLLESLGGFTCGVDMEFV